MMENTKPNAVNDDVTLDEDSVLMGNVLTNDSDPEGDSLLVNTVPVAGPSNGQLELSADGSFTYTPEGNFNGSDGFTYEVCDTGDPSLCDQAEVVMTINPVNDAPVATGDQYATDQDVVLSITAPGVLDNDTDPDNDNLAVTQFDASSSGGGTITGNGDGSFAYVPLSGYTGNDTFSYSITDNNGGTATALVSIDVQPLVNECDAPVLNIYDTSAEGLNVSWPVIAGAVQYQYKVKAEVGGPNVQSGFTTANDIQITGLEPSTEYKIRVRSICSNGLTSSFTTVQFTTKSDIGDFTVSLYPNPAKNMITLTVVGLEGSADVLIMDQNLMPRLQVFDIRNGSRTIDTSSLPSGYYILQFITQNGVVTKRFMKKE